MSAKNLIIEEGVIHIQASFNNTHIVFTDHKGNVKAKITAAMGDKRSRKSAPNSVREAALKLATTCKNNFNLRQVIVKLSGPGSGREASIRAIHKSGINVSCIIDVTPIPHNGVKPSKERRV